MITSIYKGFLKAKSPLAPLFLRGVTATATPFKKVAQRQPLQLPPHLGKGGRGRFGITSLVHVAVFIALISALSGCSTWRNLTGASDNPFAPRVESAAGPFPGSTVEGSGARMQPLPEMTAPELEHLGDRSFSRKDLPNAYIQYDKCLQKEPENKRVQYKKGMVLLAGNMNAEAAAVFEAILAKEPDYVPAREGLGQAFFNKAEFDRAEAEFRKAVGSDPTLWRAFNCLGMIYDHKKQYPRAAVEYEAAISANPRQGFLYNNLGVSLLLSGENEKAVTAFKNAIAKGETGSRVYNNLGMALARTGEYEKTLDAFTRAGGTSKAYNNIGCVYLSERNYRSAVISFERALNSSPGFYETASENLKQARTALARAEENLQTK